MPGRGDTRLCLGAIAGAQGVRGEVRIKSFTEHAEDIGAYGPLSSEDGTKQFRLSHVRAAKGVVIASIDGVRDRDSAMALKGTRLYVGRDKLPASGEDDTWYHFDLIGLTAKTQDGATLGIIEAIYDFGAGDLLDIKLETTGETVLVPFTSETVPGVDVSSGVITIVMPEGLLDDED